MPLHSRSNKLVMKAYGQLAYNLDSDLLCFIGHPAPLLCGEQDTAEYRLHRCGHAHQNLVGHADHILHGNTAESCRFSVIPDGAYFLYA